MTDPNMSGSVRRSRCVVNSTGGLISLIIRSAAEDCCTILVYLLIMLQFNRIKRTFVPKSNFLNEASTVRRLVLIFVNLC
jgi:hypothetical protein